MSAVKTRIRRWLPWFTSRSANRDIPSTELHRITKRLEAGRRRLEQIWNSVDAPRIAIVKQDICEDLYCCLPDASARQVLESTQLRSGPVALLSAGRARFQMVTAVDVPECQIWKERAEALHWESLDFFASYRDRIPGKDHGQSRYAVPPESVDWSMYDIVISIDVAVPESVTRRFPRTAWAYYVREVKAPSYRHGLFVPAAGQDLFLTHGFRWAPPKAAAHVVEFPYHLQYYGCFHELFDVPLDQPRSGTFIDHHSLVMLSQAELEQLSVFGPAVGPVVSAELRSEVAKSIAPRRTMDADLRERLLASKYFLITPGQRRVFGTSLVEAIAAGCLAIGSPNSIDIHGFFFNAATTAESVDEALQRINDFEAHPAHYEAELARQRLLIDWLCYVRPALTLFDKANQVVRSRRGI